MINQLQTTPRSKLFKSLKNEHYLNTIREAPCIVCYLYGRHDTSIISEAHHESVSFRFREYKRMNDYTSLPLCYGHHFERHNGNTLETFWKKNCTSVLFPFISVISLLKKYSQDQNLPLTKELNYELNQGYYYDYSTLELRKFIDELSNTVHYQYTTGNVD